MNGKTIVVIVLTALIVSLVPYPVSSAGVNQGAVKICTGNRYTMRGWVCEDAPEAQGVITLHSVRPPRGSLASTSQGQIGKHPDPALADLPYHYLQVLDARVPLYTTLDDAVNGTNRSRSLIPGFDFVSFDSQVKVNGKWYYRTVSDFWMPGQKASYLGSIPKFQGRVFERSPDTDFGWVLTELRSQPAPGSDAAIYTGNPYRRYDTVRIFEEREVEGTRYLKIGEDEWIAAERVGRVTLRGGPPEGVESERWIDVNLAQQTLAVYEDGELAFATLISSGEEGNWTRPGTFEIKSKLDTELMRGSFAADQSDYYYRCTLTSLGPCMEPTGTIILEPRSRKVVSISLRGMHSGFTSGRRLEILSTFMIHRGKRPQTPIFFTAAEHEG